MSVPPGEHPDRGDGDVPADFDPYRFGKPEHPPPPEYAPPGYRPPAPSPYRAPVPPPHGAQWYPAPRTGNGKAIAALVFGVASIVLCWTTVLASVPIVLAVVFGILALNDARRHPAQGGRGMAVAGIVCGVIGAILTILLTVWFVRIINDCGGADQNRQQLRQCIVNHL